MYGNSRLLGLSALAVMLFASPTGRTINMDPEPQSIRRYPRPKPPTGPVTDSTPMTKREKRRLRRPS